MTTVMEEKERQERSEVFAWLRGGDMTPDPEMEDRFITMVADAVIEKTGLRPSGRKMVASPLSIRAIMETVGMSPEDMPSLSTAVPVPPKVEEEHVPAKKEDSPEDREGEIGIDSLMVAKTLVSLAHGERLMLSMSHIQTIMYIAYGVWLATNHTRLFDEHPQVWQFGPVFPKVYNRFKRGFDDSEEVSEKMLRDYPEQYHFVEKCFRRFAWNKAGYLAAPHKAAGSPWSVTSKRNGGKLGVRIDDDLIERWFEKRI